MNPNLNRLLKRTLYSLKRRYGNPVDVYRLTSSSTDERTGKVTYEREMFPLKRVIVMPNTLSAIEKRTISIISANKQMLQGGWFEGDFRNFLIDRSDLPGVELTMDDWLVFQGRKYAIDHLQDYEFNMGWIVTGKAMTGENPQEIKLVKAHSFVAFTQTAHDT